MGLFDFIKNKLFGKTKKAEDSKKAPEKKLEKKKTPKVSQKPAKPVKKKVKKDVAKPKSPKKIEVKKEEKKGILSKIKDAILPSKKEKQESIKTDEKPKKDTKKKVTLKKEKTDKTVTSKKKETVEKVENIEEVEEVEEVIEEEEEDSDQESIKKGLEKTKKSFFAKLKSAVLGKSKIDADVLDDLEEILITSDVGVETTVKIIERIEERVSKDKYSSVNELNKILKEEIVKILAENSSDLEAFDVEDDTVPYVILVVGVNGVGKTTTIGKLASQFKNGGLKVLIGAADTFRAAAVDQIKMWGDRVGVDVVSHGMNTDPASVAFDTVKKAVDEKYDIVIIDTAGRLHTKLNLMNELSKIKRVVQKFKPDAPHEVMLILDGSTGQNAFVQAEEFTKATNVNSITITKLDGTAKGGVVIGITDRFEIPIKYIGVGEKVGDLKLFHKGEFVNSFFD